MAHFGTALDRESEVPLGTQLAWNLRAAIDGGDLRLGDRLPPVRELARSARVNVNTVRSVYARLAQQGLISSEQGRGTFVTGAARADLAALVERAAHEARRRGVDPRELASALYARAAVGALREADPELGARRALRAEIEALDERLAAAGVPPVTGTARSGGARLLTTRELEATRDAMARRLTAHRRALR